MNIEDHKNVTSSCDSTQHHWASYPSKTVSLLDVFSSSSIVLFWEALKPSWVFCSVCLSPDCLVGAELPASTITSLLALLDLSRALLMVSAPALMSCNGAPSEPCGCVGLTGPLAGLDDAWPSLPCVERVTSNLEVEGLGGLASVDSGLSRSK